MEQQQDVWIEETTRPYDVSITELVGVGGLRRYHVVTSQVESAVFKMMLAIESISSDTLILVASVLFIMVCRKFNLRTNSVLQFGENYLRSGELKPSSLALANMLAANYVHHVTRHDRVKLGRPVNVSQVIES